MRALPLVRGNVQPLPYSRSLHALTTTATAAAAVATLQVQALSAFVYESSDVVVHRDTALMPADVRDHNSINFIVNAQQRTTMATLVLPDPSQPGAVVYQSWNPPAGNVILHFFFHIMHVFLIQFTFS
jgi:hypothetical protein